MKRPAAKAAVTELRAMWKAGRRPSDLLHELAQQGLDQIAMMDLFRAAFALEQADVSCIGGWTHQGTGELGDVQVDALLGQHIVERAAEGKP